MMVYNQLILAIIGKEKEKKKRKRKGEHLPASPREVRSRFVYYPGPKPQLPYSLIKAFL
jgi:hypothetical protein